MEMINKNYKKCPLKKRPVVYETEELEVSYKQQVDEQPQDLSLKRKSSDMLEEYAPPVKREFGLNLSKKVQVDATPCYRPESPVSVTSEPSALLSPQVKGEHYVDYHHHHHLQASSNIHLRGLTAATAGYTTNPYQNAFVMAAGCNPMTALWHGYHQQTPVDLNAIYPSPASSVKSAASFYSYQQMMTPPSSPGSEDSASEPEDLSVRSDIPLPALFHQFEETSSYSALSPNSSSSSAFSRQSYNNSNQLNSSSHTAKLPSDRHFKCEKCNRMYATEKGLEKHQVFHCPATLSNQEKQQFSCGECGKLYTSNGALKMHIKTHTLPCKCHVCGKAFSRPWLLQGHLRTHTGEKPFACSVCPRRFADRSNLRAHQQTHVEVKKYLCNICNKSFSRASLLKKHTDSSCTITIV